MLRYEGLSQLSGAPPYKQKIHVLGGNKARDREKEGPEAKPRNNLPSIKNPERKRLDRGQGAGQGKNL